MHSRRLTSGPRRRPSRAGLLRGRTGRNGIERGLVILALLEQGLQPRERLARRIAAAMNGATSRENPAGVPRLRSAMRVISGAADSQVYVVSIRKDLRLSA
jgi:hypothetical protein